MYFPQKKIEYIDAEAFRICSLFERNQIENLSSNVPYGSISHVIPTTISGIDQLSFIKKIQLFDEVVEIEEEFNGESIKLNIENYKCLKKLVNTIYSEKNVNRCISKYFIEERTVEWLLQTFKTNKADKSLSTYLLDLFEEEIKSYTIHFSILYLNIEKPFKVGNVNIGFFTKEYIDFLSNEYSIKNPKKKDNPFENFRGKIQGKVYASYSIRSEETRAKEIAFKYCSMAVDILKICSDTVEIPKHKLSFDIDKRTKENLKNEIYIINDLQPGSLIISQSRGPAQHMIYDNEFNRMHNRFFQKFSDFSINYNDDISELSNLIFNSIKRYSNALSNSNLHQRIVDLFTILESLLLPNEDANIIDSVCKYCSKLVTKKIEERKDIISTLKSLYKVRSQLVHHAKEMDYDEDNLRKLQKIILFLLSTLIDKTKEHKNKNSILVEIDNAILMAY